MALADLFRPKWRHSDPGRRAAAVQSLPDRDRDTLSTVARTDADEAIRRIAIKKLDDIPTLRAVAAADLGPALSKLVDERVTALLLEQITGPDLSAALQALAQVHDDRLLAQVATRARAEVRDAALSRIRDDAALAELLRASSDPALWRALVARITDLTVLRGLAVDTSRKELGTLLVERIDAPEALTYIADKAKQRAVRAQARRRLAQLTGTADAAAEPAPAPDRLNQARARARRVQICDLLQGLASNGDATAADAQKAALEREWQELGPAEPRLQQRFALACESFERQRALQREVQAEALATAHAQAEPAAAAPPLAEPAAALAAPEAAPPPPDPETAEEVARRQAELDARQQARADEVRAALATLGAELQLPRARRQLERLRSKVKALPAERPETAELARQLDQASQELVAREQAAQRELETRAAEQTTRVTDALRQLSASLEQSDGARWQQLLDQTKAALGAAVDVRPDQRAAWESDYHQLRTQVVILQEQAREVEDWKRWANLVQHEALCKQAEQLQQETDPRQLFERLRAVQASWKTVGPAPRERADEIWKRFKTACDAAYARCEVHFAAQDAQRQQNLAQKTALCERAEALSGSADLEQGHELFKQLQGEWKQIGPVPKELTDALWQRFRAACDAFFERRRAHFGTLAEGRAQNQLRKQALCEQAERLSSSDDWNATAELLKALQREWKAVGPVPREQSEALWQRFRAACDAFFERRAHARQQEQAAKQERLEQHYRARETLCEEIERLAQGALPTDGPATELVTQLARAYARWQTEPPAPPEREGPLSQRFDQACAQVVHGSAALFAGTAFDPQRNEPARAALCGRAEALALAIADSEPDLAAATADGAALGPTPTAKPPASRLDSGEREERLTLYLQQARELSDSWSRVGPVFGPRGAAFAQRFDQAMTQVRRLLRAGRAGRAA